MSTMMVSSLFQEQLSRFFRTAAVRSLAGADLAELCRAAGVSRMYYTANIGENGRYRSQRAHEQIMGGSDAEHRIVLYDDGKKTDVTLEFSYYYNGKEYVRACAAFREGIRREELDLSVYQSLADVCYLLISRQNMQVMLEYAESTDGQTGIPNIVYLRRMYAEMQRTIPPEQLYLLYVNLQNFRYINETAGPRVGDEAIVRYSRMLTHLLEPEDCVCRIGGDNFVFLIRKEHFQSLTEKLDRVTLKDLKTMPERVFELSAWIGVSAVEPGCRKTLEQRMDEASNACMLAKTKLKKTVVFYSSDVRRELGSGREVLAMFRPALRRGEFVPFFQPKVDMRTGALTGFEALCRWYHGDHFIYPDEFVPVLDREGRIHELDMMIFRKACMAIRQWKEMGLNPPRVSSNFSRKNLFVPDIESKILRTVEECGISPEDVEIEITETVRESEYNRLLSFTRELKSKGLHISIDDFGTGYSSLSLIRNIDADAIKIDKSFVDEISSNPKSRVLVDSIVRLASQLNMSIIAEGVETAEQGRELMRHGCFTMQGYFYSRPVSFETATEIIRHPLFQSISQTGA